MENIAALRQTHEPRLRVQAGGFTAQCPRCEGAHFTSVGPAHLLACASCGEQVHRATLLHQIAANARLTALVLTEQARLARLMAN